MKTVKFFLGICILTAPFSYASANCDSLAKTAWLLGSWRSESAKRTYEETWQRISDHTYEGFSKVTLNSGKKAGYESLRLVSMSGEVFYMAKVSHNALPIAFKLVSCSDETLHFQNTHHDFPQSIRYIRRGKNGLSVSVAGADEKGFELDFFRKDVNS